MAEDLTDAKAMLEKLEDQLILGEIMESDYKQLKWKIVQQLREAGETVPAVMGSVQRAEVFDTLGNPYCHIPADQFIMGPEDEMGELLAPINMAKFPVTVEQFVEFLQDSGYDYPMEDIEQMYQVSPEPDCPVSHVSWNDAKEYCRWLRKITQEYYSLPNELEWEIAARGIDGRFYPWGNDAPSSDMACFQTDENPHHSTAPVGDYEHNHSPYGCTGMVGNVWEWMVDDVDDPRDPHILRGGSWCNTVDFANTISSTFSFPPTKRIDYGGFRLIYLPHDMLIEYRKHYGGGDAHKAGLKVIRMATETEQGGGSSGLSSAMAEAMKRAAGEQSEQRGELEAEVDAVIQPMSEDEIAAEAGEQTLIMDSNRARPQRISNEAPEEFDGSQSIVMDRDAEEIDMDSLSPQERMALQISQASKRYIEDREASGVEVKKETQKLKAFPNAGRKKKTTGIVLVEHGQEDDDEFEDEFEDEFGDSGSHAPVRSGGSTYDEDDGSYSLSDKGLATVYEDPKLTTMAQVAVTAWCGMLVTVVGLLVYRISTM
jgi:serine/threonine-protein kinase